VNLKLYQVNPGIGYRYNQTNAQTNLLTNVIPSNFDVAGSYNVFVYDSNGSTILSSDPSNPWIYDPDAGYLTFYGASTLTNSPPSMTFYRYEGSFGIDAYIPSDSSATSLTLTNSTFATLYNLTNSSFNAITLPTLATTDTGGYWTLQNSTGSSLTIGVTPSSTAIGASFTILNTGFTTILWTGSAYRLLINYGIGSNGLQGNQGAQGTIGSQGSQGIQGTIGSQGLSGASGTIGSQGLSGASGTIGSQGLSGVSGTIGSQGLSGASGTIGSQGLSGLSGTIGSQGVSGL
jgi:hypothetical protein